MQSYHSHNRLLPPGQYKYSPQFPAIMEQLSPTYTIQTEPVFFDHLLMNVGRTITVVTTNGSLEGKLTGVAVDHIQLTIDDVNYHIRLQHITYYIGKP